MAQEKRGYALKVERGERPFIYSQEHSDWRRSVDRRDERGQADAARAWSRRFGMWPRARGEEAAEAARRHERIAA